MLNSRYATIIATPAGQHTDPLARTTATRTTATRTTVTRTTATRTTATRTTATRTAAAARGTHAPHTAPAIGGAPAAPRAQATGSTAAAPCPHMPACPAADRPDREAAHTIACHPEQGWSLLCNGVVLFHDTGQLLPDRTAIAPRRGNRTNRRQPAMAA